MERQLTLDLALITHGPGGILRVAAQELPRLEDVRYVVSWQDHRNAPVPPELAARDDVDIHRLDLAGQSLNRNNAIDHCRADIILHADDDIIYTAAGLRSVIDAFAANPEVDVATFRSIHESGCRYPAESVRLRRRLPRNYSVATFEIAFRRSTAGSLRCHPELGLGSPRLHGGEDEAFLMAAIRRGLNCRFFTTTICTHDHPSTGTRSDPTDANLRASGCVVRLYYPLSFIWRIPLKAVRLSRSGRAGFGRALRCLCAGALAEPGVRRRGRSYLW